MKPSITLLVIVLISVVNLHAQSIPNADSVAVFEAIPNNLVFEMLALPGNAIQQPGTVSEALLSLTSIIGTDGSIHPGLGITIAPYQLAVGEDLELKDYIGNWWTRFMTNAQFSLGTAPSRNSDSAVDWGVGVRFVFFNSGDARTDQKTLDKLAERLGEVNDAAPDPIDLQNDSANTYATTVFLPSYNEFQQAFANGDSKAFEAARAALLALIDSDEFLKWYGKENQNERRAYIAAKTIATSQNQLKKQSLDPSWNAVSLDFNLGVVYSASESKIQKSDFQMFNAWLNGGIGFGPGQFLAQIGMQKYTQQGDSIAVTAAAMLRFGNAKFRFGLGGNGIYTGEQHQELTASLVSEYMVSQSAWVVFSINAVTQKGARPEYIPQFGIKTNGGFFHL